MSAPAAAHRLLWGPCLGVLLLLLGCPDPSPGSQGPDSGAPLAPPDAHAGIHTQEVKQLTLEVDGQTTRLSNSRSGWRIVAPLRAPVDHMALDALLVALSRGVFGAVLAEDPDAATLRSLGLSPPRLRLTVEGREGPPLELEGGAERPFDGSIPLRRKGSSTVHAASGKLRQALSADVFALRSKRPLPLPPEAVGSLEVLSPKGTSWKLERTKRGWDQTRAPAYEADPDRVERLLKRLSSLRVRAFAPDTAEERQARGLTTPAYRLHLQRRFGEGEKIPFTLEISAGPPGPSRTVWITWQPEDGDPTLAEVDARLLEWVRTPPETLRVTRLLRFDAGEVAKVALTFVDAPPVTLLRSPAATGDGTGPHTWTLQTEGRTRPVSTVRVSALLFRAAQLRARAPRDPQLLPLRDPERGLLALALWDAEGAALGSVALGAPDPDQSERIPAEAGEVSTYVEATAVTALDRATAPFGFGVGQEADGAQVPGSSK